MINSIMLASILATANITSPDSGFAGELVATWAYVDSESNFSITLDADGRCAISSFTKQSGSTKRVTCTYWVHGSRVGLRLTRWESTDKLVPVMLDYIPQSDTLIVDGKIQRVLTRRPVERSE